MKQSLNIDNHIISIMSRPFFRNAQRIVSLALIGFLASSCSIKDDISGCDDSNNQEFQGTTYLTIAVGVGEENSSSTRADKNSPGPDGGQDGETNELGFENEYMVNNLTLLLCKKDDGFTNFGDANSQDNIVTDAFYFSNLTQHTSDPDGNTDDDGIYYKSSQYYELAADYVNNLKNYQYFIITNVGDVSQKYKGKCIVDIADEILKGGWSDDGTQGKSGAPVTTNKDNGSPTTLSQFIMTSDKARYTLGSNENKIKVDKTYKDHAGTKEDPFLAYGKVTRLAARIDFMVEGKSVDEINKNYYKTIKIGKSDDKKYKGFVYDIVDDGGKVVGKYLLTHVLPFNCLNAGSYFVKHLFSPDWDFNNAEGISHILEYLKPEQEVFTTDGTIVYKHSTNWVLDPWSQVTYGTETYSNKGTSKTRDKYVSHENKHTEALYTNYLSKGITESSALISNSWTSGCGWDEYKVRPVEFEGKNDNGCCYILTYTNENTSVYKNSYDNATGVVFRGLYFTTDEWNNGNPTTEGKEMAYKYYLRHSDPHDYFNKTGNPDDDEINSDKKMVIDKTKLSNNTSDYDKVTLKNTMLYGIVRNNIYRVSIDKVKKTNDEEGLTIIPKIQVRKWATYTHDEITM